MAKTADNSTRTKKEPGYPVWKYFELFEPGMHPYTRAYVEERFRGKIKTRTEWAKAIKSLMEGNK